MRALPLFMVWMLLPGSALAQPGPATSTAPLTLQGLERMALEGNPTLRQAMTSVTAAQGRARQAGTWFNPTVGYSGEEIKPGEVIRLGEHGAFFEQQIPLGGKLRLSRQVFEREADQAGSFVDLQRERILAAVRTLFYAVLTTERRVEVLDRLAQLASEAVGISGQLYNVGAADRPDVLDSEIEADRIQLELIAARNRRFALWRQLAVTVGDRSLMPRPLAGVADALPEITREGALTDVLRRSPQVRAARAEIERTKAVVARARREPYPGLFVRVTPAYNRERLERGPGGGIRPIGWELGALEAGVTVPLFNRNTGAITAALADQARAEAELGRLELAIEARLASVFEEYLTALRANEIYRDRVLPRANENYQLYLARYQQMAAAYPQVLVAQRTLFQMTEQYFQNLETAWRAALRIQGFLLDEDGLGIPMRPGEMELDASVRVADAGGR
ncbi:MAG: TolC family protein [Acidobacteria bacterium]|nr:TolC family protein [Acidobacteriota bacterium]